MPIVEANGQQIYYTDTGGDLPVVVFSHGLFMNSDMFAAQIAALRDSYRCIAWDERGHGRTGPAEEEFSYWDSAEDLRALLRHLDLDRAVLVGMSQGGYLSLRFALRYPELVAGLVLLDSQARGDAPETEVAYRGLIRAWQEGGVDAIAESIGGIVLDHRFPLTKEWIDGPWRDYTSENIGVICETLLTRESLVDRLGELTMPALVVWGENDLAISEESANETVAGLPGAEPLVRIADAGHAANLTHPDDVNPPLAKFLAGLGSY